MIATGAQDGEGIVFGGAQPILRISNLQASVDYWDTSRVSRALECQ
jgi:hypothetical protein